MTASTPTPPAAPRLAPLWAMLTCALAALTLAHPALGGQFLVSGISDQYLAGYAFREYAASSLSAGNGFPLWNPYLFGGMPYVAAMHGDIFYPTFLLRLLLGADTGMTWGMILHVWLAGVLTYGFLRASGLSFGASLIGGLAYMMSGPIAGLVSPGHDGKIFVSALFPLMLLCLTWGIRDGKAWSWGALMLVSGLGVLTPHPQLYQYMLLGAGAYALLLAFGGEAVLARGVAIKRLGLSLAGILGGWLIGAIQFVPVLEYVPWSPRSGGKGWDHAVSYSMPPEELINGYLPQFSGILENYWGRNGIHFHSDYIGVAVLMLAVAGFAWGRRKEAWFWVGFLAIAALWSFGGFTPFYRLIFALVPGAKFFRAPSTFYFLAQFATAVLAARGAERLLTQGLPRRHVYGWVGFGVVMLLLAMSGALRAPFIGVVPDEIRMARFSDATAVAAMGVGALRSLLVVLGVAGLMLALERRMLTSTVVAAALAGLMIVDFWSVERLYWNFSPPAAELYKSDAIIEHIKARPEPGRVLALQFNNYPERDAYLSGDALMAHDLRLVMGYHGNEIGRYDALLGFSQQLQAAMQTGQVPPFWRLTNTRWLVYDDSSAAFPGTERVMGPVLNGAGHNVWLFEVTGENPAAWVTAAIMKQPDDVVESALNDPRFPAASVALFPADAPVEGQQLTAAPPALAIRTRSVVEPGHITVELDAPAPAGSALMVSENYYPGWTATIDGKPGAVHRADLSLMGVPLPAGATKVELTFASASYERGKLITLIGIALALLLLGAGALAERKVARG